MKTLCRMICRVLCFGLVLGLFGCNTPPEEVVPTHGSTEPTETTAAPTEVTETTGATEPTIDPILAERRDAAEAYMRAMATYLWRAEEDIIYTRDSTVLTDEDLSAYKGSETIKIKAGRLYRGVPDSNAGTSPWNFYDYAGEADEKGIHTVSGLHWRALNGGAAIGARVGNDCSAAVQLAWSSVGGKFKPSSTQFMVQNRGFLKVGDYESDPEKYYKTTLTCTENGEQTMYDAYAQLQKADAVVMRKDSYGHTMMVVDVNVVYKDDGTINASRSNVTVLHQTSSYIKAEKYTYDETLGENVYTTFGIDDKFTFSQLFMDGYLPVTCDALIDPAPVEAVKITDSEQVYTAENILTGVFTCNRIISGVGITITDKAGNVVADAFCYYPRTSNVSEFTFDLAKRFEKELAEVRWGELDPAALTPGEYHCTHTLRDAHGTEYVVRDFDFTVS